jgi:Mg2+ and Co2+ transporter CorA
MRTEIVVQTDLSSEVFGISDENDNIIWADATDEKAEENKLIAKALGCSPELVKEIASAFSFFIEQLEGELAEIWQRMDKLEKS